MIKCPLCRDSAVADFHSDRKRDFKSCLSCQMVFVPPEYHLSPYEERIRYNLHQNDAGDPGYRSFLERLYTPVRNSLRKGDRGLDFGSGPKPVLAHMFREDGFETDSYDPFFAENPTVFARKYDFITASEVLEHLRDPGGELERIFQILKPGGILGIMTEMLPDRSDFGSWYYKRDMTHISFYSPPVFRWIARNWNRSVEFPIAGVALFRRSA